MYKLTYKHTYMHIHMYRHIYICATLPLFADDVNYSVCCGCICICRFLDRSDAHLSPITIYSLS